MAERVNGEQKAWQLGPEHVYLTAGHQTAYYLLTKCLLEKEGTLSIDHSCSYLEHLQDKMGDFQLSQVEELSECLGNALVTKYPDPQVSHQKDLSVLSRVARERGVPLIIDISNLPYFPEHPQLLDTLYSQAGPNGFISIRDMSVMSGDPDHQLAELVVYDPLDRYRECREGLSNILQVLGHPCTIHQIVHPRVFTHLMTRLPLPLP